MGLRFARRDSVLLGEPVGDHPGSENDADKDEGESRISGDFQQPIVHDIASRTVARIANRVRLRSVPFGATACCRTLAFGRMSLSMGSPRIAPRHKAMHIEGAETPSAGASGHSPRSILAL